MDNAIRTLTERTNKKREVEEKNANVYKINLYYMRDDSALKTTLRRTTRTKDDTLYVEIRTLEIKNNEN